MRISLFNKFISPLIYLFGTPGFALAAEVKADPCPKSGAFKPLCDITGANFGQFVGNFVTALMVLAALISLVFLIYGGVKWIMSEGDKTAVETARQTIIGAIVGLVVVFLSYLIVSIILGLFGITLANLVIPNLTVTP
mgnify:CR=1 FL=1